MNIIVTHPHFLKTEMFLLKRNSMYINLFYSMYAHYEYLFIFFSHANNWAGGPGESAEGPEAALNWFVPTLIWFPRPTKTKKNKKGKTQLTIKQEWLVLGRVLCNVTMSHPVGLPFYLLAVLYIIPLDTPYFIFFFFSARE